MISQETIQEVVRRLVETYNPLEIYLFGSYAYGTPNEDSDLDLLIVIEKSEEQKAFKRSIIGCKALWGLGIPKDILVYTQDEFQRALAKESSLSFHIKNEGKCLYARA